MWCVSSVCFSTQLLSCSQLSWCCFLLLQCQKQHSFMIICQHGKQKLKLFSLQGCLPQHGSSKRKPMLLAIHGPLHLQETYLAPSAHSSRDHCFHTRDEALNLMFLNQSTMKSELMRSPGESVGSHPKTEHTNATIKCAAASCHTLPHTLLILLGCIQPAAKLYP